MDFAEFDALAEPLLRRSAEEQARHGFALIDGHVNATGGLLPRPNPGFDRAAKAKKDKSHGWNMALRERAQHEKNLKAFLESRKNRVDN